MSAERQVAEPFTLTQGEGAGAWNFCIGVPSREAGPPGPAKEAGERIAAPLAADPEPAEVD